MPTASTKAQQSEADARPTLDELDDWRRVLWYGDGGKAKTTNLCTLANRGRLVLIAADPGLKASALRRRGVKVENIEPILRDEISYNRLEALFWELKERLDDEPGSVLGLGWDSITETINALLHQSVAVGVIAAQAKGRAREQFDVYKDDWGNVNQQIKLLLRMFGDLPLHIGLTALARRDTDEEGAIRMGPAVNPALVNDMIGFPDVVVNVRTQGFGEQYEYSGLCLPEGRFEAKDRYGLLPRRMVEPTFERILDYLDEKLDAESDPLQEQARQRRRKAEAEAEKAD